MTSKQTMLKIIHLALMVQLVVSGNEDDEVVQSFLDDHCTVQPNHPGTFKVHCSCKGDQHLTISKQAIKPLPTTVTRFDVTECNDSAVTIKEDTFISLHSLENLTFTSIGNLHLESRSISLELFHGEDFKLVFNDILNSGLSLEKEAVIVLRDIFTNAKENLVISNAILNGLPESAINGSFTTLDLNKILLKKEASSRAIDVGEVGSEVTIHSLNVSDSILGPEWLVGYVRTLRMTQNNIVMQQRAFAGIQMRGLPPFEIVMQHNQFGSLSSHQSDSRSKPSLPSGAFDIDVSSVDLTVVTEDNLINCECEDLAWILNTSKKSLREQINFVCSQGTLLNETLEDCRSRGGSHSKTGISFLTVGFLYLVTKLM